MSDETIDDLLAEAFDALESGDHDTAEALLERAKALAPGDPDVLLLEVELRIDAAEDDEGVDAAIDLLAAAVERDPEDAVLAARLAAYVVEVYGDYSSALPLLERAGATLSGIDPEDEEEALGIKEMLVDVLLLVAECRSAVRDPRGALAAADRAAEIDPDDPLCHLWIATGRFDLCELDAAREALDEAMRLDPHLADGAWLLGRIATVEGKEEEARRAFAAAVRLDPERFSPPTRISEDELVALVEEGLAELPRKVRDYLENVAIVVEDVPALDRLTDNDPPLSPGSLGLFEGTPPAHESTADPWSTFPRQITLFRKNIEIDSESREDLRELAVTTLLHEVGHFLGLDEEDLDERGLG